MSVCAWNSFECFGHTGLFRKFLNFFGKLGTGIDSPRNSREIRIDSRVRSYSRYIRLVHIIRRVRTFTRVLMRLVAVSFSRWILNGKIDGQVRTRCDRSRQFPPRIRCVFFLRVITTVRLYDWVRPSTFAFFAFPVGVNAFAPRCPKKHKNCSSVRSRRGAFFPSFFSRFVFRFLFFYEGTIASFHLEAYIGLPIMFMLGEFSARLSHTFVGV